MNDQYKIIMGKGCRFVPKGRKLRKTNGKRNQISQVNEKQFKKEIAEAIGEK